MQQQVYTQAGEQKVEVLYDYYDSWALLQSSQIPFWAVISAITADYHISKSCSMVIST